MSLSLVVWVGPAGSSTAARESERLTTSQAPRDLKESRAGAITYFSPVIKDVRARLSKDKPQICAFPANFLP